MTDSELASLAADSPIHRNERTWLLVKHYLLRRLRGLVPGNVEFGPYWVSNHHDNGGSFCCRLRCRAAFPFVPESDTWEASLCTSGDKVRSWTDMAVFPFRCGRVVRPGGTFWNLRFAEGHWTSNGWTFPDGPGEWEWVKRAGDCYLFPNIVCEVVRYSSLHRPPIVAVRPANGFDNCLGVPVGTTRVSLHDVRHTGTTDELGGETVFSLANSDRPVVVVPMRTAPRVLSGEIDLGRLPVRGGWVAGAYKVNLRVRYEPHRHDGPEAFVTAPITFTIR
ncbi:hypothetical protein FTUN_4584 [Frigoriglobus tundricola]|uniref:Uncharacterized protein n=1 Tax=Frigoriglobus tundricola TaxID=2774151 RepID=A0A6M5YUC7_9BACT|nr:hypothetical protein FTUN_4584 [Frigoriglobus tundricola]